MNRFINQSIGLVKQEESLKLIELISSYNLRKYEYLNMCPLNTCPLDSKQRQQKSDILRTLSNLPAEPKEGTKDNATIPDTQHQQIIHKQEKAQQVENKETHQSPRQLKRSPNLMAIFNPPTKSPSIVLHQVQSVFHNDEQKINQRRSVGSDIFNENQNIQQDIGEVDFQSYIDSEQQYPNRPPTIQQYPSEEEQQSFTQHVIFKQQTAKQLEKQNRISYQNEIFQQQSFLTEKEQSQFLLRMENFELKQQMLVKKLMNKFNRTSNTKTNSVLAKLESIKWQDLNLPKSQYRLKKFNYNLAVD